LKLDEILPDLTKGVINQTLGTVMIVEREVFLKEDGGIKNGFYERNINTAFGKLENLKIPRDREGNFRTKLIEPYKARGISLEDLILGMFAKGMSIRYALESVFELNRENKQMETEKTQEKILSHNS
jgi:putative transposase